MSDASVERVRGPLSPGTQVGRYHLLRRLARGGMAELYLARVAGLHGFQKLCVLKLVLPHLSEDRRFVDMFLHEARMAATLEHPNIVHVMDIGEHQGEPYFVMQYVRGRDVRQVAKAVGGAPLPLDVAATVASQVAAGLHHVHEQCGADGKPLRLVHRDVSPANVMIGFDGNVKLVDFGIAKSAEQLDATRTGVIKGKVSYMSPEQCRGRGIDRRTDIFALGILLYEMTTGRRLFPGETDFAVMSKIVDGVYVEPRAVDPQYPEALQEIVCRALATAAEQRYATAAQIQSDVEAFARQYGLHLSGLTLSQFMVDVFGEPPPPGSDDPSDEAPTALRPDAKTRPRPAGAVVSRLHNPDTRSGEPLQTATRREPLDGYTEITVDPTPIAGDTVVASGPDSGTLQVDLPDAWRPSPPRRRGVVAAGVAVVAVAGVAWAAISWSDAPPPTPVQPPPAVNAGAAAPDRVGPPGPRPSPPAIPPEVEAATAPAVAPDPSPGSAPAEATVAASPVPEDEQQPARPTKRKRRPPSWGPSDMPAPAQKAKPSKKKAKVSNMYPSE